MGTDFSVTHLMTGSALCDCFVTALAKEVTSVVIHIQLSSLAPSTVVMGHLLFHVK